MHKPTTQDQRTAPVQGPRAPQPKDDDYVEVPDPPRIPRLNHRIATLERRMEFLEGKLRQGSYASSQAASFDRAEVEALGAGIAALKYVRACSEPED